MTFRLILMPKGTDPRIRDLMKRRAQLIRQHKSTAEIDFRMRAIRNENMTNERGRG